MSGLTHRPHPLAVLAAALVVLPFFTGALGLPISLASELALFAMVGLGFNLLLGYTGLLSFGHGAFFGLAAYAAALLQIHLAPGSFLLPVAFAVTFAALAAWSSASSSCVGAASISRCSPWRSPPWFSTSSTVGPRSPAARTVWAASRRPAALGIDLDDQNIFYVLSRSSCSSSPRLIWRVVCSPFGRVLVAIRENEQRARLWAIRSAATS